MKKFCLSLLLLMAASAMEVLAQSSLVATLNHNDTISVYYGIDALKSAYTASVSGDVITLSSGGFNAPNIFKEITIRGAGMEQDTINKVAPTILMGNIEITSSYGASENSHLTLEGLYLKGGILLSTTDNIYLSDNLSYAQFIKCRLENFRQSSSNFRLKNVKFIQCKVKDLDVNGDATFINSFVGSPTSYSSSNTPFNVECVNCIVVDHYTTDQPVENSTFVNSVFIGARTLGPSNMAYNCVGVYVEESDTVGHLFTSLPGMLSNVCFRNLGEVFDTKTYDGGLYSDSDTFQLLDSIRTKYLGTDGTEVGMYGGSLPFNPQNSLPKIKKFNVASKSNAEGKLSVEIEVSAATE